MVNRGSRPLSSSSPRIQLSIFSMMSSLALSLHLHLHLLAHSILPGLSASRTHMLTFPPSAPPRRMVLLVQDSQIPINLELPRVAPRSPERGCSGLVPLSPHTSPSSPSPSQSSNTAPSDRQGELTVGCVYRAREEGHILCI